MNVAVKILKNRKPFYNQGLVEVKTLQVRPCTHTYTRTRVHI